MHSLHVLEEEVADKRDVEALVVGRDDDAVEMLPLGIAGRRSGVRHGRVRHSHELRTKALPRHRRILRWSSCEERIEKQSSP
jgi:hypothetical protein